MDTLLEITWGQLFTLCIAILFLGFLSCYLLALHLAACAYRKAQQQEKFSSQPDVMDETMQRRLEFLRHLVQSGRLVS